MGLPAFLKLMLDAAGREDLQADQDLEADDTSEDPEDMDAEDALTEVIEDFPNSSNRKSR